MKIPRLQDFPDYAAATVALARVHGQLRSLELEVNEEIACSRSLEGETVATQRQRAGARILSGEDPDDVTGERPIDLSRLRQRRGVLQEAERQARAQLETAYNRRSAEICATIAPQHTKLVRELLASLITAARADAALAELRDQLHAVGLSSATLPVLRAHWLGRLSDPRDSVAAALVLEAIAAGVIEPGAAPDEIAAPYIEIAAAEARALAAARNGARK
jgi:hypothetical protein